MKALFNSPAIIMRITEFRESDLIVSFFTSDRGRLKGIAKGARKSQKRFVNCLDLFCLTHLEYEQRRKDTLHFLQACKLINAFPGLRKEFSAMSLASYAVELTEILFPVGVVDRDMFALVNNTFDALDKRGSPRAHRIHFEGRAMALGGYSINLKSCCRCGRPYAGEGRGVFLREKGGIACLKCAQESRRAPGLGPPSVRTLESIQGGGLVIQERLELDEDTMQEIRTVLDQHLTYRLGRRLKTEKFLR